MSLVSEVELKEILPKDGPSIKETKKYLKTQHINTPTTHFKRCFS